MTRRLALVLLLSACGQQVQGAAPETTPAVTVQNVRAAAALCTFWVRSGSSCYRPWGGSG